MGIQKDRLLAIQTPLGADVLLVNKLRGREYLSGLFRFELELLAELDKADQVKPESLIGQTVAITTHFADGKGREINGLISRFAQCGQERRFAYYTAEVVPTLWLLTLSADCRIFPQGKTVPDIVKQVLQERGVRDVRDALTGKYTALDYCVQYRETHFNFISRLLEGEGIFYFFEHKGGKHTMVLADGVTAYPRVPGEAQPRFDPLGETGLRSETVFRWECSQELRSGKHVRRDHNFQLPGNPLQVEEQTTIKVGNNSRFEVFDYPGDYAQRFYEPDARLGDVRPEGQGVVRVRMEEDEAAYKQVQGEAYCRGFTPGHTFRLGEHPQSAMNGSYVVTAVEHEAVQSADFFSDGRPERPYRNRFVSIPDRVRYRPPRATPKPVVQGPQSAVVVGKKGEEIWTDKYGRVKVQFHWDREGKQDEQSSCWVRVAQSVAGKRWGAFSLPRIGQEVLVAFMEGDPDQPIIVGGVYNAEQMPPYDLPAEQTKSTIKSNTSKGGVGFNELRFEDQSGKEQIFLHAERDLDARVKHDAMELVLHDRHLIVGDGDKKEGDQRELTYGNKHLNVKKDHVEKIEGNMLLTVGKGEGSGGNQDIVVEKNKKETVEADSHQHIKGDCNEKIDGTLSRNVGMKVQEKVGMNHALDAGQEIHLKAGMKVVIEGGLQLTIKGAGGFIDIGPAGVTIQGTMVMINSGGAAGSGSGSSPTSPQDADEAKPDKPTEAANAQTGAKSAPE